MKRRMSRLAAISRRRAIRRGRSGRTQHADCMR
jgi:hypothetical protein